MTFRTFWKMLNSGKIQNWHKRAITINIGTCITVPLPDLKAFADDPSKIEKILDRIFTRNRFLWRSTDMLDLALSLADLTALSEDIEQFLTETIGNSANFIDQEIDSHIKALGSLASDGAKRVEQAYSFDMRQTYFWGSSGGPENRNRVMRELLPKCFLLVEFLVMLLPEGAKANKMLCQLADGKTKLIRDFGGSFYDLSDLLVSIE